MDRQFARVALFGGLILGVLGGVTPAAYALDRVRVETGVEAAAERYGVTGRGVLVAILDRGLDWKSNDFRNADGSTRLDSAFDLTDDTGARAANNAYQMGTVYSRAQIDAALRQNGSLPFRDAVGHGTTTTGIACGNGRNSAGKYRGIAPNATILSIKVTSDGAPAHDGQPAEAAYWQPNRIATAIDFARDRARQLGLPCVMLLNLGSIGGPTDGTSDLCRKIDTTVGPGIPGLVFVTGSGDDGGTPNHAAGVVRQGETVAVRVQKGGSTPLLFDLWYPESDRLSVTIQTPGGRLGPYQAPATADDYVIQQEASFLLYHLGAQRDFLSATNDKRQLWIRLEGPRGEYQIILTGTSIRSGRFDATLNPTWIWQAGTSQNRFLNFAAPGSIWDGAAARYNICPNSYVIRTQWTDIDGRAQALLGQGRVGELWTGSSVGPTFDGRLGIDVSAPGDRVVAPYSPTSHWATIRGGLIKDGNRQYGIAGAVSAASPIVTGIIALMLEANPKLDAAAVKRILQQSARADAFTGAVPNATWGYGKVDALAALALVKQ
jgi:subtilisin family serine protease